MAGAYVVCVNTQPGQQSQLIMHGNDTIELRKMVQQLLQGVKVKNQCCAVT